MRKQLTLVTILVMFTGMALAGITSSEVIQEFDSELTGGETTEAVVEFDNDADTDLPVVTELAVTSKDGYTLNDPQSSAFGISGELDTGETVSTFDPSDCVFDQTGTDSEGVYFCEDGSFVSESESSNTLTTTVETALNLRSGTYDLELSLFSGVGDVDQQQSGLSSSFSVGDFSFENVEGSDLGSSDNTVSTYSSVIYPGPSEDESFVAGFGADKDASDAVSSADVVFGYDDGLVEDMDDYEIKLYKYDEGWEETGSSLDREENLLEVEGIGFSLYAVYVEELEEETEEESTEDSSSTSGSSTPISERETSTNIVSQTDRSTHVSVRNVAENRPTAIELPESAIGTETGSSLSGIEFSLSRSTGFMDIEVEAHNDRPGTAPEIVEDDFEPASFHEVSYSGTGGGEITEAAFSFEVDNSKLEDIRQENVVVYRAETNGEEWQTLETEVMSEEDDKTVFRAESPGMSVVAQGTLESDIRVVDTSISSMDVQEEEEVVFETTVENSARGSGEHTVELVADGETLRSETVTVEGGETYTVSFTETFGPGEYDIMFADEESGKLTATETPEQTVEEEPETQGILKLKLLVALTGIFVAAIVYRFREDIKEKM